MKFKRFLSVLIISVMVMIPVLSSYAFASYDETPLISESPKNLCWPQGSMASYQCVCENDKGHEKFGYEWHIVYEGKDYKFDGGMSDPWCAYIDKANSGTVGNVIMFDGVQPGLNGAEIYCSVISGSTAVSSPRAVIIVGDPIMFVPAEISAPTHVSCMQGDDVTLKVSAKSKSGNVTESRDFITYNWYSTDSGSLRDIQLIGAKSGKPATGKTFKPDTSEPGTYYYVCGVFDGEENAPDMCNYSYTNVITLEIEEKISNVDIQILSLPAKTEYTEGDTLDLTGMKIRIVRTDGYLDLSDGAGVTVSPEKLSKAGEQTVTVTYEELKTGFKVTVKPAEAPAPKIVKQPQGGAFKFGEKCTLTVEATTEEGCTLYYQWYYLTDGQQTDNEIFGAVRKDYTVPQSEGDAYYRCYVYAVDGSGNTSAGIPTDTVKVTYTANEETTSADGSGNTDAETDLSDGTSAEDTAGIPADSDGENAAASDDKATETAADELNAGQAGGGSGVAVLALTIVAVILFMGLIAAFVLIIIMMNKKK